MSQNVCVIGLGDMGSALAEALLAKGHRVTVWNRTSSKGGLVAEAGASVAESVHGAITEAQTVVVCVIDHDASESLLMSDDVARSLRGKLLVQLSTVTAEESRALGRWAEKNGIDYLDGSILGYRQDILRNSCPIVYSGPKKAFDANEGVLASMGGDPRLISETVGSVAIFDKAFYLFHWGAMLAFFHGAAMCHAAGFPTLLYAEWMLGKVGENTKGALTRYAEMIVKRSYKPESLNVDVMAYEHVKKVSEELGVDTTFPKMVASHLHRVEGHDRQSLAVIFEIMLENGA